MSARFRKTRRYTKVVCGVLKLCTGFFHQTVHSDDTVHAVSARFGNTKLYKSRLLLAATSAQGSFIKQSMVIKPSML